MSEKKITVRRICPACEGRGKSFGPRYCGCCYGRHKVTESVTIEDVDSEPPGEFEGLDKPIQDAAERIAKALEGDRR